MKWQIESKPFWVIFSFMFSKTTKLNEWMWEKEIVSFCPFFWNVITKDFSFDDFLSLGSGREKRSSLIGFLQILHSALDEWRNRLHCFILFSMIDNNRGLIQRRKKMMKKKKKKRLLGMNWHSPRDNTTERQNNDFVCFVSIHDDERSKNLRSLFRHKIMHSYGLFRLLVLSHTHTPPIRYILILFPSIFSFSFAFFFISFAVPSYAMKENIIVLLASNEDYWKLFHFHFFFFFISFYSLLCSLYHRFVSEQSEQEKKFVFFYSDTRTSTQLTSVAIRYWVHVHIFPFKQKKKILKMNKNWHLWW